MIFIPLKEAADEGRLILVEDGLCRWKRRKRDGVVVIYEILVSPWRYGQGIGRRMIDTVRAKNPGAVLLARCPVGYEANLFWQLLGFVEVGRTEKLIEWRLDPSWCSAPTAMPLTLVPPLPADGDTASVCPPEGC